MFHWVCAGPWQEESPDRGIFHTYTHLFGPLQHFSIGKFTHVQHWIKQPSAPGSLLGQKVGAHQAQLLVSGLQVVWCSTNPKSTTGPLGAEEQEHSTGILLEAVLETADSLFSWQSQHERWGAPAPTCRKINQQMQVNYLALHIHTSVGCMCSGTKL